MNVVAELDPASGRIVLESPWSAKELVKELPGSRWDNDNKRWHLPLGWGSCVALRCQFGIGLQVGSLLERWAWEERGRRIDPSMQIRDVLALPDDFESAGATEIRSWRGTGKLDLFGHQEVGALFLARAGDALLGDQPGVGKTASTLSAIRLIGDAAYPVLVVCPNTVKRHWAKQMEMWLPEATAYVLAGTAIQRRKVLEKAHSDPYAVIITNIEAVRTMSRLSPYGSIRLVRCPEHGGDDIAITPTKCEVHLKELNEFGFVTCVLDEAHRVKDPKSKQTRAMWSIFHGDTVRWRWGLTGTPIANHPGDLWALMHTLSPADYPRRSSFVERYAEINWNPYGMEVLGLRPDRKDEFFAILRPRFRRVAKEAVLSHLPPKVFEQRPVELSPKQLKAYRELESSAATVLESGDLLSVANNLSLATRLLQFASSSCQVSFGDGGPEDWESWVVEPCEPSPKLDEAMDIIDELAGEPCVVVAEHRKLLVLLGERLDKANIPFVSITGAVDERQRAIDLERFQNGEVPVLLFTSAAGGVGLDMTRAGTMIRLQRSWSLVNHLQSEDRCHRPGAEIHESIRIIDIIAEGTIEDRQLDALSAKDSRLAEVVGG